MYTLTDCVFDPILQTNLVFLNDFRDRGAILASIHDVDASQYDSVIKYQLSLSTPITQEQIRWCSSKNMPLGVSSNSGSVFVLFWVF